MQLMRFLGNIARVTLAIGALSVTAFAGAEEIYPYHHDMSYANFGNPCAVPPCGPASCGSGCGCGQPCEPAPACNWGYNPPAYLRCASSCCNNDGFWDSVGFRVDFLWWRPTTELLFGVQQDVATLPTVSGTTTVFNTTHEKRPNFKFDPGFRIGIAHVCPCDCSFDVMLNWTHFHSRARVDGFSTDLPTEGTSGDYTIFTSFFERGSDFYPDTAVGQWKLDLDLLDLEFGYKYYICPCIAFRPHAGLRGARINQRLHTFSLADRTTVASDFTPSVFDSYSRSKSNFLAIGPRVGFDVELDLGCGLSIVGCAAESLLFGRFERHGREHLTVYSTIGTTTTASDLDYYARGRVRRDSVLATDLAVGLKWSHCFTWCNRCHPVSVSVLWEHHGFRDVTDFGFYADAVDSDFTTAGVIPAVGTRQDVNDLYTQGLTLAFELGF